MKKNLKIAFLEYIDNCSTSLFPSVAIAQIKEILIELGGFTEIPFYEYLHKYNSLYNLFLEERIFYNEFKKKDLHKQKIFKSLFEMMKLVNFDILIISFSWSYKVDIFFQFLKYVKSKKPSLTIVAESLFDFEDMVKEKVIDYVFFGQNSERAFGQNSLKNFKEFIYNYPVDDDLKKSLSGISYMDNGKFVFRFDRNPEFGFYPYRFSLSDIAFSETYLFNSFALKNDIKTFKNYSGSDYNFFSCYPYNPLFVANSVGCVNSCAYCHYSHYELIERPIEDTISEMKYLHEKLGSNYFFLGEANHTRDKEFIDKFANNFNKQNFDIYWSSAFEPNDNVKEENVFKLKNLGCVSVFFGVDIATKRLSEIYNRKFNIEEVKKAVITTSKAGIYTECAFVIGLPRENDDDFKAIIDFCDSVKQYVDRWYFFPYTLLEPSGVFANPEKFGVFKQKQEKMNWYSDHIKYNYSINEMSYDEYLEIQKKKIDFLVKSLPPNKLFSLPAYHYLKSKTKVNELLNYVNTTIPISVGLGSNQECLESKKTSKLDKYRFLPIDYLSHFISKRIHTRWHDSILLVGGEPLIHPNFFDLLNIIQNNNYMAKVKTNARMLSNLNFCKEVSKYCDEILVVDPANNKEDYEKISKVNGSWEESRKGIENWKLIGKKVIHFSP